jgi:hypothetical protein
LLIGNGTRGEMRGVIQITVTYEPSNDREFLLMKRRPLFRIHNSRRE